jgi:hypothetical protein
MALLLFVSKVSLFKVVKFIYFGELSSCSKFFFLLYLAGILLNSYDFWTFLATRETKWHFALSCKNEIWCKRQIWSKKINQLLIQINHFCGRMWHFILEFFFQISIQDSASKMKIKCRIAQHFFVCVYS